MNARRNKIDEDREKAALERIGLDLLVGLKPVGRHLGWQCRVLDAIADARAYGARKSACCELLGLATKTVERWMVRRQAILDGLGDL